MIPLTCSDIAAWLGGSLIGTDVHISAVSTDSRHIAAGSLFIALKGPNFDGSAFIADVVAKGAVAVITEQASDTAISQIIVPDSQIALGQLAAKVKALLAPRTVAVTGSAGKTTVKEMLAAILQQKAPVLATQGNFNNDIGVPLTLLRLTEEHQFAVIELGANHAGEIAYTTSLTKPDIAIITNVAASHLEGFGSVDGVATAKGEIFAGLPAGGTAIIQADSAYRSKWQPSLQDKNVLTFGSDSNADFYPSQISYDHNGCAAFILHTPTEQIAVKLALPGRHNITNALAATAAAIEAGASLQHVRQGLATMQAVKGRTNIIQAAVGLRIIDDTYNANVESVTAAIDLLASYSGLRILVLGDMGELGQDARLHHETVGIHAAKAGINLLFTLGVLSLSASDVFNGSGAHCTERSQLVEHIINEIKQHITEYREVTLLVKGSRSAKMELVVQDLLERCKQESTLC